VAGIAAIEPETHVGEIVCERSAQIGEGMFGATRGGVAPLGCLLPLVHLVDPGDGGDHQTEIEMVVDRTGI
jgi:hypothetical protein